jgi:hypothetical protein
MSGEIDWSAAICLASPSVRALMIGWAPRARTHSAASALIDKPAPEAIAAKSRRSKVGQR